METHTITGYLDTCLVSGLAKRDLAKGEQEALSRVLQRYAAREIALVTSQVTREEIERIPDQARRMHEDLFALLVVIPAAAEIRSDGRLTLMGVGGGAIEDPILTEAKTILPHLDDARHLFQAIQSRCTHFVTTDERTILSRAESLQERFGIEAVLPSAFLAALR